MKVKKETLVVAFYILYFCWLFLVTFLSQGANFIDYFSGGIVAFYFLFLGQKDDILWFLLAACVPIAFAIFSFSEFQFKVNVNELKFMPLWLPLSWGTTVVALRKFFRIIT